jgi:hypothetical protein
METNTTNDTKTTQIERNPPSISPPNVFDPRTPSISPPPPSEKTPVQKKADFENIVKQYLESNPILKTGYKSNELEIRFGTNPRVARPVSKIDYDNVVQQLRSNGFRTDNVNGVQMLRIQNEYTDKITGRQKPSNVRAEIVGIDLIQEYCRTNNLQKLIDMPSTTFNKVKFTKKNASIYTIGGTDK